MQSWHRLRSSQVNWRGTSYRHTLKPHPEASVQLLTAEISLGRDIPMPPEPILASSTFDFFAFKHIDFIPPCYDYSQHFLVWIPGLDQFGMIFTFNLDPLVTLTHDAIHRQRLARHAKIKEQFEKMESRGKIMPTVWANNLTQLHDH